MRALNVPGVPRARGPVTPLALKQLVAVTLIALAPAAWSADPPSVSEVAGPEAQRQQERERALRERLEAQPDVRLERPAAEGAERLPAQETPCFRIDRISLAGEMAERFQWALAAANPADDPAIGRCLGAEAINLTMKRVQNAIIARGFITTRVLAAPQDLKTGSLELTVVPGRVRNVRFSEESSPRATKWNAVPAAPGDLLNLRDIEQALENFKRVPTVEADIQITPAEADGARPGESDLVIVWRQGFPFRVNLSLDDAGSKATGKYQAGVTVSYDDWLTLNDLFYVSFNQDLGGGNAGDKGSHGYTVHYEVPYDYWLLGLTAGHYDYHQSVAGINQTYIYRGESDSAELRLSRLLYRDAVRKTGAYLRLWSRESRNFIDDTEVLVQHRRMAGWEAGFTHKEFIGAGSLDAAIGYRRGTGAWGSIPAPEENFNEGTARPELITAEAQLNLPFALAGQQLRYSTAWRAQWNLTPLVPQDRFSIGNRYTVRGFDGETTLAGDHGWLLRNELGWAVGGGQEVYVGADYGEVGGQSADRLIGKHLGGIVLGLRGGYKGVSWDLFAAQPVSRPTGFKTAGTTTGFNLNWSF